MDWHPLLLFDKDGGKGTGKVTPACKGEGDWQAAPHYPAQRHPVRLAIASRTGCRRRVRINQPHGFASKLATMGLIILTLPLRAS